MNNEFYYVFISKNREKLHLYVKIENKSEEEDENKNKGLSLWIIVLIIVSSILIIVLIIFLILYIKNKKRKSNTNLEERLESVEQIKELIEKQLEKYDCYIEEDKNNKLEFELYFDKYEKDEEEEEKEKEEKEEEEEEEKSEENILSMQIILYETPKGFLLRFLRKKIDKRDFIEKYVIISKIVENLIN